MGILILLGINTLTFFNKDVLSKVVTPLWLHGEWFDGRQKVVIKGGDITVGGFSILRHVGLSGAENTKDELGHPVFRLSGGGGATYTFRKMGKIIFLQVSHGKGSSTMVLVKYKDRNKIKKSKQKEKQKKPKQLLI